MHPWDDPGYEKGSDASEEIASVRSAEHTAFVPVMMEFQKDNKKEEHTE